MLEVDLPEHWIGKTIGEIDIRRKYGISIMGVRRNQKLKLTITPETMFEINDMLLVLGKYKDLQKCFKI